MSDEVVIRTEGLWKRYGLPLPAFVQRGRHWLRSRRDGPNPQSPIQNGKSENGRWALRDVDLEVKRGETLGIIGRNGAGKSTLLKVLAGVTPPTLGRVEVRGRVFPMIELNAGIHPELTGRENVYLLGAIVGLTRREIGEKMPEIEGFCEIGEWFDRPVRMYSTGMLARLGFGVAMNVSADVLLIDEVLAVGDLIFQRKCYEHIEQLKASEVTIILVSHNIRQIARLCDPVILVEEGAVTATGTGTELVNLYYERCVEKAAGRVATGAGQEGMVIETTGELSIQSVTLLDETGREIDYLRSGDPIVVRLEYNARDRIEQPIIGVGILSPDMLVIGGVSNLGTERPDLEGHGWIDCRIPNLPLLPGAFHMNITVKHKNGARLFTGRNMSRLNVIPSDKDGLYLKGTGLVALDVEWCVPEFKRGNWTC